jgi:hypothetical protein
LTFLPRTSTTTDCRPEGHDDPLKRLGQAFSSRRRSTGFAVSSEGVLVEKGNDLANEIGGGSFADVLSDADQLDLALAQRTVIQFERDAVLRLLRGGPLEIVAQELAVTAADRSPARFRRDQMDLLPWVA